MWITSISSTDQPLINSRMFGPAQAIDGDISQADYLVLDLASSDESEVGLVGYSKCQMDQEAERLPVSGLGLTLAYESVSRSIEVAVPQWHA